MRRTHISAGFSKGLLLWLAFSTFFTSTAKAQPIPTSSPAAGIEMVDEIPEEILRTEIITEARSPLTGEPISAAEYAQLQAELAEPAGGNLVSQDIRYLLFLLQVRRAIKPIVPFIKSSRDL